MVASWACDEVNECGVSPYSEEVYINFYDIETKGARSVSFNHMDVEYGDGTILSLVDTTEAGGTGYAFPLDLSQASTSFLFDTDTEDYDLLLSYNVKALIENPECGPTLRVTGISAESTAFDSVVVKVTELSKLVAPHVEIYF